jgi:hypothetical protein
MLSAEFRKTLILNNCFQYLLLARICWGNLWFPLGCSCFAPRSREAICTHTPSSRNDRQAQRLRIASVSSFHAPYPAPHPAGCLRQCPSHIPVLRIATPSRRTGASRRGRPKTKEVHTLKRTGEKELSFSTLASMWQGSYAQRQAGPQGAQERGTGRPRPAGPKWRSGTEAFRPSQQPKHRTCEDHPA